MSGGDEIGSLHASYQDKAGSATGEILDEPQLGERVRCMIALAEDIAKKPVGNFRLLNSTSLTHSPIALVKGDPEFTSAHRFDNVFGADEAGSTVLAALLPFAMACASGTDSSIATISSPSVNTSSNKLFDRSSGKCAAVKIIEALLLECKKRHQQCYVSLGALDPKSEGAVDLLASRVDELFPVRVPFTPSIRDSNVFPHLHLQDVLMLKKPADVVHRGLVALSTFEEHATISKRCDVFAVVTVESRVPVAGGAHGAASRDTFQEKKIIVIGASKLNARHVSCTLWSGREIARKRRASGRDEEWKI